MFFLKHGVYTQEVRCNVLRMHVVNSHVTVYQKKPAFFVITTTWQFCKNVHSNHRHIYILCEIVFVEV